MTTATKVFRSIGSFSCAPLSPVATLQREVTAQGDRGNNCHGEKESRPINLYMQATTPMDTRVLDAMHPVYTSLYGNLHSFTHAYLWEIVKAIDNESDYVAGLIGVHLKIIFTPGDTESNNLSIKHLQEEGYDITYLPIKDTRLINMERLETEIRPGTRQVSVMVVNRDIGVTQPMGEIGKLC
ncbi:pyridoxal phosphate-dependent transferase [Tuber indicum]|nr:pyridoxal phosphate-dependent transferase [Tuber indicum]